MNRKKLPPLYLSAAIQYAADNILEDTISEGIFPNEESDRNGDLRSISGRRLEEFLLSIELMRRSVSPDEWDAILEDQFHGWRDLAEKIDKESLLTKEIDQLNRKADK